MDELQVITHEVEIKNCAENFEYFCEKYVKVNNPKRGLIPFILHDFQKRYIKHIEDHRHVISKKFRQGGFTTTALVWLLWRFLFKPNETNMVVSCRKIDAEGCNQLVRNIFENLPDFMRPRLDVKNKHKLEYRKLDNKLIFRSPESVRGCAVNYMLLDEVAFTPNMHKHWMALFPVLSNGGHCIALSTTNGTKNNWFYDIYTEAEKGRNDFKVFTCCHTEHPDYSDSDWALQTKQALGIRGWRQEVLCEFVDEDTRTPAEKLESSVKYLEDIAEVEELVQSLTIEGKINKLKERDILAQHLKDEKWTILSNPDIADDKEPNLYWDDEEPICYKKPEPNPAHEKIKPEVYQFKKLTETDKKKLLEDFLANTKEINHPEFDKFSFRTTEEIADFWHNFVTNDEDHESDYALIRDTWVAHANAIKKRNRDIQERIDYDVCADMLAMAGLMAPDDAKKAPRQKFGRPDLVILEKLCQKYEGMILHFEDGHLCVNSCPTTIIEDDVRDMYNGIFSLRSYSDAIHETVVAIEKKLDPLFKRREVKNEQVA